MRILGIDPGSRITGVGIIEVVNKKTQFVDAQSLKLVGDTMTLRLGSLVAQLGAYIQLHKPDVVAIEEVFVNPKNIATSLKLAQARGVALATVISFLNSIDASKTFASASASALTSTSTIAGSVAGSVALTPSSSVATVYNPSPIYEYAARLVKKTIVGIGSADKIQVQHMIKLLLKVKEDLPVDACNALAIALCHATFNDTLAGKPLAKPKSKKSSWRNFKDDSTNQGKVTR